MTSLAEARLQAHWAVQLVSAPGTTLLERQPDLSNTNLSWSRALQALVGTPVHGRSAALRIADLTLLVGDRSFPLRGRTYQEASAWLAERFDAQLERSEHEMPPHPVADGAVFGQPPGLADLAGRFDAAHTALAALGGDVFCWPHHFDIASLFSLGGDRTIGAGMAPGDGSYPEPYYYVTPWPYPDADVTLPSLTEGTWHRQGWTGAVLPAVEDPTVFLKEAIGACRLLLGE